MLHLTGAALQSDNPAQEKLSQQHTKWQGAVYFCRSVVSDEWKSKGTAYEYGSAANPVRTLHSCSLWQSWACVVNGQLLFGRCHEVQM